MTGVHEILIRLRLEIPEQIPAGPARCHPRRPAVAAETPQQIPAAAAEDGPLLHTVPQTAELLQVGVSTVSELIAVGKIKSIKIGAARRIPREAITDYIRRSGGGGQNAA